MDKLLLVEDDSTLIRMVRDYLTGEGFAVTAVTGQTAAQEAMEREKPELALVDISLAEGNGFGVFAEAKARDIPVIFLTASSDEFSVVTGLDMGADDYISKPFRPRELVLVFLQHRGQTLTRDRLLEEIWDCSGDFVSDNTLTVYIKRLREKIEPDPQNPRYIRTVRGLGYRLEG